MAVPRLLARGRCLVARTTPSIRVASLAIPSIRTTIAKRDFNASQCSREDIVQTPSGGSEIAPTDASAPTTSRTAGIALFKMSKRLAKREIEEIIRSKGFTIKRMQLRLDRFSFQNDCNCFLELGSEAEATRAIKELRGLKELGEHVSVSPLRADFVWRKADGGKEKSPYGSRYFFDEGSAALDAVRPFLERRRTMLCVKTPGWSPKTVISLAEQNALRIIDQYFGKYGIERLSKISPFYGNLKLNPRLLCFMDFKTTEGAENAIKDLNNTIIEDRLTWLKVSQPSGWRLHQIGKVSPEALEQIKESGLVVEDEEISEDKFVNPLPKK